MSGNFSSFSEVGKKLGEMWHALSEDEREDYRQRAKDQAEVKLREWHEKMKEFPDEAMNPLAQVTSQVGAKFITWARNTGQGTRD